MALIVGSITWLVIGISFVIASESLIGKILGLVAIFTSQLYWIGYLIAGEINKKVKEVDDVKRKGKDKSGTG